jgi:hypothetical protein
VPSAFAHGCITPRRELLPDRGEGRRVPEATPYDCSRRRRVAVERVAVERVAHAPADRVRQETREALHFRFGEQPVQELLPPPLVAAKPADEPLLALVLETDHEKSVWTVDRRRHDLELRDL